MGKARPRMATTWVLIWLATWSLSPGLSIETGSPDALCPEQEATRAAIESRLGVIGVDGRAGWTARYTMWHAPDKDRDFVRLEVTDPSGARRLERDLPLAGESCSTMANVIALVLDRYFRELDGGRESTPLDVARGETPRERHGPAAVFGVSAGAFMNPARPAILATLAIEEHHLRLAMEAGWSPDVPTEAIGPSGSARLTTSVPVRLAAGWRGGLGRFQIHGGPELLFAYERARARVPVPGENSRLTVGVGLQAGAALSLGHQLRLTAHAALDRVLGQGRFTVDDREVLQFPWRAVAAIGIAYGVGDEAL